MAVSLVLNRKRVAVHPSVPLLWAICGSLGLTGTEFGCGIARCAACTADTASHAGAIGQ